MEAAFAFNVSSDEFGLKKEMILLGTTFEQHLSDSVYRNLLIPVGERHHDVECGGDKDNVE